MFGHPRAMYKEGVAIAMIIFALTFAITSLLALSLAGSITSKTHRRQ
jgi:hypothetical protein